MTDPEGAPVLPRLDHLADPVDDIEHAQTSLQGVNRLVEIRRCLLRLQQRALLFDKTSTNLGDALIKARDALLHLISVRLDSEEGRHRLDKVLIVFTAYLLNLCILGVDEGLHGPEVRLLLSVGMDLLDDWAKLLKILGRRRRIEQVNLL